MAKLFTLLSVAATAVLLSLQNASARPLGLDGKDNLGAFKETTKSSAECVVVKSSNLKSLDKAAFLKGRGEPSKFLVCSGTSITAIKFKDEHGNEYDLKDKYYGSEDKYDFKEQQDKYEWDDDKNKYDWENEKDDHKHDDGKDKHDWDDGKDHKEQNDYKKNEDGKSKRDEVVWGNNKEDKGSKNDVEGYDKEYKDGKDKEKFSKGSSDKYNKGGKNGKFENKGEKGENRKYDDKKEDRK